MRLLSVFAFLAACDAGKQPVSDHSDGKTFFNTPPVKVSVGKALHWQVSRKPHPWPDRIEVRPTVPDSAVETGIRATWIGHASALVQAPGLNLLTDPVWSRRAGPWSWLGSARRAEPGVAFEDLPRIDAVLVSHDHYDHLDLPTLRRLARERAPMAVAPLGTAGLLEEAGFGKVVALDWWQSTVLPTGDTVTLAPAYHHGARWPWDRNRRLWGGFVVSTRTGKVYFAGDTGDGPLFDEIGRRLGPFDLALIPIGAYLPRWFMAPKHIGPAEAVEVARRVGARTSVAIHWGVFPLADDGPREAPDSLRALLGRDTTAPDFRTIEIGQAVDVPGTPRAP